eukprot:CAMPEP_0181062654 /NCGR_PEP_ID=MMETSP1070-20121207/23195_1 /TAXON_ID=265543 /ORGANISM="Minutocellus polymorphus, Strain NH13" /LENGTH=40 /DNA_ID= /DNA_START= /DNA_END= /DNA_ORIENTATION=
MDYEDVGDIPMMAPARRNHPNASAAIASGDDDGAPPPPPP